MQRRIDATPAARYARVSSDRQDVDLSVAAQLRKMLDEASETESPWQEIQVWKFSRFTRKREHAVAFKSMLRRRGIRVTSITEHADDTQTGKLMETIIESVDEFYSENLAQEVRRRHR